MGNPIHSLVALIKIARPDLNEHATSLMTESRRYFDLTRIFIPDPNAEDRPGLADQMAAAANGMLHTLNAILDAVCGEIESADENEGANEQKQP